MSIEVYLLSIPLARHREIVPRRRSNELIPGPGVRPSEHRMHGTTGTLVEHPWHAGTLQQRIDPG
jgi:hypothetical protein